MTAYSSLRRYIFPALTLAAAIGFAALGIWQWERRTWKLDLIERVSSRIHAEAVGVPPREAWPSINAANDAYRRVYAEGRFRHQQETLVQAVTEKGPGFWVLTPLETDDGSIILVNRGFVPPQRRDRATRLEGLPDGSMRVAGLLRVTETRGGFLRENDAQADRWYSRDVTAIAAARHLRDVAPFFVDADATLNPGGWPLGGQTVVAFHSSHFVYMLTWFTLALMSIGATLTIVRKDWRRAQSRVTSDLRRAERPPSGASSHLTC